MASICIIGSGKAAGYFAKALTGAGHTIEKIVARNASAGKALAEQAGTVYQPFSAGSSVGSDADIILLAVSDNAIQEVAKACKSSTKSILVHLSGAQPADILKEHSVHYGVMWPLQTLVADMNPDPAIPLIIEGSDASSLKTLRGLAQNLSGQVEDLAYEQRASLHLAAVFANNFSNYIYHLAWEICRQKGISFSLLLPLIQKTVKNLENTGTPPLSLQSGPASRKDTASMEKHIRLLEEMTQGSEKELYILLSDMISKQMK